MYSPHIHRLCYSPFQLCMSLFKSSEPNVRRAFLKVEVTFQNCVSSSSSYEIRHTVKTVHLYSYFYFLCLCIFCNIIMSLQYVFFKLNDFIKIYLQQSESVSLCIARGNFHDSYKSSNQQLLPRSHHRQYPVRATNSEIFYLFMNMISVVHGILQCLAASVMVILPFLTH